MRVSVERAPKRRARMGKKIVHVEFPAKDADRAEKFWEGLGGWSIESAGMEGMDYRMFQDDGWGGAVYPQGLQESRPATACSRTSPATARGSLSAPSTSRLPGQARATWTGVGGISSLACPVPTDAAAV